MTRQAGVNPFRLALDALAAQRTALPNELAAVDLVVATLERLVGNTDKPSHRAGASGSTSRGDWRVAILERLGAAPVPMRTIALQTGATKVVTSKRLMILRDEGQVTSVGRSRATKWKLAGAAARQPPVKEAL